MFGRKAAVFFREALLNKRQFFVVVNHNFGIQRILSAQTIQTLNRFGLLRKYC